jgi:hypothetical protein
MSSPKKSPQKQHDIFVETARELGCDEDEAAFDDKLRILTDSSKRKNVYSDSGKGGDRKAATPANKGK